MKRVLLVSTALVLSVASPAWAKAPPSNPVKIFLSLPTAQGKARTHSCAKGGPQKQVKLPGSRALGDLAHKAVVACEQPPRSQPFLSGLKHTEAAALLALVG
jgi:hypothetical protein